MAAALRGVRSLARRGFAVCSAKPKPSQLLTCGKISWRDFYTSLPTQVMASTQVLMPALSPTMEEGTIVTWLKKEGDAVEAGDALCEIETDKATITMDTDEEGVLAKIIIPSGSKNIKVNQLIALIVAEGEDYTKVVVPVIGHDDESSSHSISTSHAILGSAVPLSPAVRYLVETNHLDPTQIPATGRGGRILKSDILKFVSGEAVAAAKAPPSPMPVSVVVPPVQPPVTSPPSDKRGPQPVAATPFESEVSFTDIPNTGMRSVIAKRLTESKTTIPHVYATADCTMDRLLQMRNQLKDRNIKVSVNDLIVKVSAIALHKVPEMNAIWNGEEAQQLDEIDVAIAVATDGGLITPVIRDAANLDLSQISLVVKDLALRARGGKLQLHEFQGGSFTISNLGMYGILEFTAVINPPQASILAVGGTRLQLSPDEKLSNVMTVSLSCDARIVDNELASRWLETFQFYIENPELAGL